MTWSSRFLVSSLLVLTLGGIAVAAENVNCTCNPTPQCIGSDDSLGVEWIGWRRDQVLERLQATRLAGHWSAAVDTLVEFFISHSGSVDDSSRARTLAELAEFRREAVALESGHPNAAPVTLRRFSIDASTKNRVVVFEDPGRIVRLTGGDPITKARAVCWTVLAAKDLAWAMTSPERKIALKTAEDRVRRWDNLRTYSYTQFPVEMLVNGFAHQRNAKSRRTLEPVPWQLILLHPSIGTSVVVDQNDWTRTEEWRRQDVMVLELAGLIRYRDDFRKYFGASWVATFPTDSRPGAGVLIHFGKHLEFGPVWPRVQDRVALLASLDVRQWLGGVPRQLNEFWDQAKAQLRNGELAASRAP